MLLTRVSKCINNVVGGNIRMDNNSQFLHNEHNIITGYPSLIQPVMYIRKEVAMNNRINRMNMMIYEYCNDLGCICSDNDERIIEHNMLDGWSREMSEALLGEHKYGGM